jgi:hypothetical protein
MCVCCVCVPSALPSLSELAGSIGQTLTNTYVSMASVDPRLGGGLIPGLTSLLGFPGPAPGSGSGSGSAGTGSCGGIGAGLLGGLAAMAGTAGQAQVMQPPPQAQQMQQPPQQQPQPPQQPQQQQLNAAGPPANAGFAGAFPAGLGATGAAFGLGGGAPFGLNLGMPMLGMPNAAAPVGATRKRTAPNSHPPPPKRTGRGGPRTSSGRPDLDAYV